MTNPLSYVLITPARNEAEFIKSTIRSVIAQTARPIKWVVVSDGSTDDTDDIVTQYAADHCWIELLRMPERKQRHFAGKVAAFNAGYERVEALQYDAIVSLDADISFDEEYFAYLLQKLTDDPTLGVVGTPFKDGCKEVYDYRFVNIEHVSGACQVFRRECFEQIGGYVPVEGGGIDLIAVITARMKGWKTRTFSGKMCFHHREMGTAHHGVLAARFRNGIKDYAFGNHPLWELSRTLYQMTKEPVIVGGTALAFGYVWAQLCQAKRPVSQELVSFCRREQIVRLKRFFNRSGVSFRLKPRLVPDSPDQRVSL
jgi:biofilm PGA synthesis N-glycosyltransferase PgaC